MTDTPVEGLPLRDEIFQRMDELTPAERKVARTLLARYPAAGLESTAALAAAAGTSKPTVLRLLDRLGFGSYPEFQQRLRDEVTRSMSESPLSRARARQAVPPDASVFMRAVELRAGLVARLQDTVPPGEIERAVSLPAGRPKHVVISGGYFSRLIARMLAMQLDQLILNVDFAAEPRGADLAKYLRAGRDSVVIVYDLRRYELAAREVVSLAKTCGASVILITDESLSPSAEEADIVLPVAVDGAPFDSFAALLVITESLVDAVFHEVGEAAIERMAGGRDPLFTAQDAVAAVEEVVAPALRDTDLSEGFKTVSERMDALPGRDGGLLHTAVRYGVTQAVLGAVAHARRLTMAEVIRDEHHTGAPLLPVPLYAQTGDDRYSNAEKMILKGVDVLPHGLINNVAEKFGPSGEILADYVRWLVGRIRDLAPSPGYRPRLHLDLYGCAGLAFGGDTDAVAAYLAELGTIAQPYDLAIEHPIDAGSREAQIATFRRLRDALSERESGVRVVVDEWCNTLDDVRAFVAAGAADVIHVKTPDLGSIGNTVEALLLARDAGPAAYCGGTCNETDRSAQVSAHVAMACQATQVLAKPGMGVDEGLMIVANEMARTAALVRAREAAPHAR